jgi:hypothetical protein
MFCIIFGISMDYEVFLLSRVREAYENGDSNTASVVKGLVSTAGIITSAAAIIIVVTGAFAFSSVIITKAVGLGLAVAVFVDATIIRVLLVPATMRVLGDWNWWPGGRKSTFGNKAHIGGAARVEPQDEADAGPALLPAGITGYLYLGSAVVLVLVVAAAALTLTMVSDGRPVVSHVRQPLISQAPETSAPGTEEDARTQQPSQGDEQRADDEDNQNEEADQRSQAEQGQGDSSQAQVSASATASASVAAETAPATAEPGAASSLEVTEEPDERSPVSVRAPASAPQSGTAPPSSSPATGGPTAAPSGGSRNPPIHFPRHNILRYSP